MCCEELYKQMCFILSAAFRSGYSHPHCSEVEAKASESLGKGRSNVPPCDSWPLSVAVGVRGDWQSQWDSLLTETGVPGCG